MPFGKTANRTIYEFYMEQGTGLRFLCIAIGVAEWKHRDGVHSLGTGSDGLDIVTD